MAHQYRIPKELRERLDSLRGELLENIGVTIEAMAGDVREEAEGHSEAFAEASESYQASGRGLVVSDWITSFDTLADELDDLGSQLETVSSSIEDLTDKPEG